MMKPTRPLHADYQGPLKPTTPLQAKKMRKPAVSSEQRRCRFHPHIDTCEQRRCRFQTDSLRRPQHPLIPHGRLQCQAAIAVYRDSSQQGYSQRHGLTGVEGTEGTGRPGCGARVRRRGLAGLRDAAPHQSANALTPADSATNRGNCTTRGSDTPITRHQGASCRAKPPLPHSKQAAGLANTTKLDRKQQSG